MYFTKHSIAPPYSSATAVMLSEIVKVSIALGFYIRELSLSGKRISIKLLKSNILNSSIRVIYLPSFLYCIHNNLQFVAAGYLDPTLMQVSAQSRLLMTAGFSLLLLKRTYTPFQWICLSVLYIGVVVAQASEAAMPFSSLSNILFGSMLMLLAAACSGWGAVLMEGALKTSQATFWQRNVQVCAVSLLPSVCVAFFDSFTISLSAVYSVESSSNTISLFFTIFWQVLTQGLTLIVWAAIICHALGGFIVAGCLKFADAVSKGVATSLAVVVVGLISLIILETNMGGMFVVGSLLVVIASILYTIDQHNSNSTTNKY